MIASLTALFEYVLFQWYLHVFFNKNFFLNFNTSRTRLSFLHSKRPILLLTLNCLIWPSIVLVNLRSCPYACVYLFSVSAMVQVSRRSCRECVSEVTDDEIIRDYTLTANSIAMSNVCLSSQLPSNRHRDRHFPPITSASCSTSDRQCAKRKKKET